MSESLVPLASIYQLFGGGILAGLGLSLALSLIRSLGLTVRKILTGRF